MSPILRKLLSTPLLLVWLGASFVTIIVPPLRWNGMRQSFYKYQGQYNEYENQQRNNDGNNNQNNNNNYNPCKWWQWSCKQRYNRYQNYNNNNNNENNLYLPDWYYRWGGVNEEDRREREEAGGGSAVNDGALGFVYAWTLIWFVVLVVILGAVVIFNHHSFKYFTPVIITMVLFAQFMIMQMIMVVHGVIETEDRMLEDSMYGWYGQTGVLIFMSCRAYLIFCSVGAILFFLRAWMVWRREKAQLLAGASGLSQAIASDEDVEMQQAKQRAASAGAYKPPANDASAKPATSTKDDDADIDPTAGCASPPTSTQVLDSADTFLQKHGL